MFEVRLTSEASEIIRHAITDHEGQKAGIMIHRQGPVADNSRDVNGLPNWKIERPYPWAIQVGSYETISDDDENIIFVDGIRIWLPLIPRKGELGVIVTVKGGQLYVEEIEV